MVNTMIEPTCPSPAPLGLTPTVRSAFAQAGTAPDPGGAVRDGDCPAAMVADPAVGGEVGLAAPTEVGAVAVVLPAAGVVEEPHPVKVTQAVSSKPPTQVRAEPAIACHLPLPQCVISVADEA